MTIEGEIVALAESAAAAAERAKYEKCWESAEYRRFSPGEAMAWPFLREVRAKRGESIIDVGCGPGRASLMFHRFGLDVTAVDTAKNCLDDEVSAEIGDRFLQMNLWDSKSNFLPPEVANSYAYCADVMEHIPPEYVEKVIENVLGMTRKLAFFYICLRADHFGAKLNGGHPLHLTVKPYSWWRDVLQKCGGHLVDGRDLIDHGWFIVRPNGGH